MQLRKKCITHLTIGMNIYVNSMRHLIKSMNKMDITLLLDKTLDVSKTTKTVENGLLTIRIPVKAEEKPVEFEI